MILVAPVLVLAAAACLVAAARAWRPKPVDPAYDPAYALPATRRPLLRALFVVPFVATALWLLVLAARFR